ncbi:hypothetical protein HDU84_004555 [Entophlyctis sp. JEL0112]|nr:hypothetical protein HDU84_004555 [Entophlyctis sp. JEL0112]
MRAGNNSVSSSASAPSPYVMLMGTRRSGKTAIHSVVFKNTVPDDTLFTLPSVTIAAPTTAVPVAASAVAPPGIQSSSASSSRASNPASPSPKSTAPFLGLSVLDTPGTNHEFYYDPALSSHYAKLFERAVSVVFVLDAQDDAVVSLRQLFLTIEAAHKLMVSVMITKSVKNFDANCIDIVVPETQREIQHRIREEFNEAGLDDVHIGFHLTSIYDHSVFEAFSKVVQRILGAEDVLPTLENLLNILRSNSGIEKAFLFDTPTKIYIATDSSPVDVQSYELCADMMDVVIDISAVYSSSNYSSAQSQHQEHNGSVIRLSNSMVLYMRAVDDALSLVCLLREENFEKSALIDFNFAVFRDALIEVFTVRRQRS